MISITSIQQSRSKTIHLLIKKGKSILKYLTAVFLILYSTISSAELLRVDFFGTSSNNEEVEAYIIYEENTPHSVVVSEGFVVYQPVTDYYFKLGNTVLTKGMECSTCDFEIHLEDYESSFESVSFRMDYFEDPTDILQITFSSYYRNGSGMPIDVIDAYSLASIDWGLTRYTREGTEKGKINFFSKNSDTVTMTVTDIKVSRVGDQLSLIEEQVKDSNLLLDKLTKNMEKIQQSIDVMRNAE